MTTKTNLQYKRQRLGSCVILILLMSLAVPPCLGQRIGGSIVGEVRDPSGAIAPLVSITITHVATKVVRQAVTNDAGFYEAVALPVGEYEIAAELKGFKRQIRRGVLLETGQKARIDFILEVGEVTEKVDVEANAPLIEIETSSRGEVIDNKRIVDLPLKDRSFASLTLLVQGATE